MNASLYIEVKPSPSEGLGIYACREFRNGDHLLDVIFEREITESSPLDIQLGERSDHCSYPNGKMMLVAFPTRHMNHSCDPNSYYVNRSEMPKAYARRTILVGEELTFDYMINNFGGDSWACSCGSERCRGETGTSYFELPIVFQREYYPLLSD
jgi:hypothetical protein|tara:strand:+ start:887 stop:1348 length:462 start_codon:yes stop_codon:yes gene_type:complete